MRIIVNQKKLVITDSARMLMSVGRENTRKRERKPRGLMCHPSIMSPVTAMETAILLTWVAGGKV
jgi:hypothetical protein